MKRILIIGNAGSGKTTFSKQLSARLDLPLIHLDKLYWYGDWQHFHREEFDARLQTELKKSEWIIDGNFNRTMPHRLKYCDTVFYFDLPVVTCLLGVTKRILKNYGKAREDMGGNCIERFDKQKLYFYKSVIKFNKWHRDDYYKLLHSAGNIKLIVFKSRRQVKRFLKDL